MSVPKSRREHHDFIAGHKLRQLRLKITELALYGFGYDKDRFEKRIEKFERSIKLEPEKRKTIVEKMRLKNQSFYADFIKEETKETRKIMRAVVCEFELGNSIYPSGDNVLIEYCEKRKHLNNSIGWLYCLKQELQYIAEVLPVDKNRFEPITKEIKEEISLIKGVRKSSNKYLKKGKQGSL